ncbi:MAG: hypothetical protein HZB65_00055 [Candidatus Aenigmarchaeota archaeon]|nr:hypothetical protein [Candidatus Aenigmarchaeota archaeon]
MYDSGKSEKLVLDVLRKERRPLSTYEIAKLAGISWSTANTCCYKLFSKKLVVSEEKEYKTSLRKIMWWIK